MSVTVDWWSAVLAGPGGSISESGEGERYLALPTRRAARVVVDATNPVAIGDALTRMVEARSLPGADVVARVASRVAPQAAPSWRIQGGDDGSLRVHLKEIIGADITLSVAIGPPRPNQKPVVRIYDGPDMVAIAKMGPDLHTAEMVTNEARWLTDLTSAPMVDVQTAEVLHHGEFGTSELLVMSPLPLVSDLGLSFAQMPTELLTSIANRAPAIGLAESPYWTALLGRAQPWGDADLERLLTDITSHPRFESVATGLAHGDWSPWNIGRGIDGQWCVWDWERAAVGVPFACDLLHLHLQYGPVGFDGGLLGAAEASRLAGHADEDFDLATTMYLAELLVRHHEANQTGSLRDEAVRQLIGTGADTV